VTPVRGFNPRQGAVDLLACVLDRGQNLAEAEVGGTTADSRDRAFARHLAYGVLRWLGALEWLAARLLQKPLKARDRDVHRLVLLGLFQLWRDDGAAHAAINETAEVARLRGKPWAVGLVNAVLRRFQRERSDWLERLGGRDERFAHPDWLLGALRRDWPGDWRTVAEANNAPAPLWLRVSPRANRPELEARMRAAGYELLAHPDAPDAISADPATAPENLPGFDEGWLSVQDPAAQLAAPLLQAESAHRVLDACAAPGGKSCHLLDLVPGIELWALDRSPARLERVRENLARLRLDESPRLHLQAADAGEPDSWWDGKPFQRILLDAPCSATGVIRRHPEIKWLRTPAQVEEAARQQARLLERLWPLLEPGGILLYATCSVLKDENSRQIERFTARQEEARCDVLSAAWGRESGGGRQLLPGERGMDGFYYARLRKG
jgi:16S rRNA (cytosine967-C5)-methyltransferase